MSEADILEMRKVSPSSFFNPPFGILLNSYEPEAKKSENFSLSDMDKRKV